VVCELGSIGIFSFFTVTLCQTWSICYKILCTLCHGQCKQMLQILLLLISTFSCVHILWLNCMYRHTVCTDIQFSHNIYTRESRNHTVNKFAAFVHVVCGTMCTKFCSKQITFDNTIVKKLKIPTRAWLPLVFILRVYNTHINMCLHLSFL